MDGDSGQKHNTFSRGNYSNSARMCVCGRRLRFSIPAIR